MALADGMTDWRRDLLCDPQTSGGLLISVASDQAGAVLERVRAAGFAQAAVVGRVEARGAGPSDHGDARLYVGPA